MSQLSIQEIFNQFNTLKVLIIGDVMIDSYLWGSVDRISPEAPVPIVAVHKKENRLGGAANVAVNIQALGAKPILCSIVGEDAAGMLFSQLLEKEMMTTEGIIHSKERVTTVKTRVLGNKHQMLRIDEESDKEIQQGEFNLISDKIKEILNKHHVDVIILEDYDKGVLNPKLIEFITEEALKLGIPTAVDPKKRNFNHYKKVSLFKPNLKELRDGLKIDLQKNEGEEFKKAVDLLRKNLQLELAMVTLSEHGIFISDDKGGTFIPAHPRGIVDVSGAGDTVISVASLCLALGTNPEMMAGLANLAGGLVCEESGVVPINKELLLREALVHYQERINL